MSGTSNKPNRLAHYAALIGAGATAATVAHLAAGRKPSAPPAAPSEPRGGMPFATDSAFVGLIESVAAATAHADSIEDAVQACVEHVCRWTGWPVGHAYFCGKSEHDFLQPSHVWYLGHPTKFEAFRAATLGMPLAPGIGLPGRVAATGRPAWIVDVTCDANFPRAEAGAEVGLRGAFSFPIPIGDKTFAVVECFSLQAVTPDDRLLEVTAHIGRQLGRQIASQQLGDALRESENRFRSVAESATDAIVAADQNGDIISWNRGAELMFGHGESDVVGKALSILMPERFRPMHDAGIARVAEGGMAAARLIGQTVEVVGLRKDGREFPLELSLAMWETAGKRFFSGIIRDISERKKAEEKLKAVLETAPDPIVEVNHDGTIGFANARTDKLFGYDREQILGRPVEELFAERTRTLVAERFAAVLASTESDSQVALGMGLELWGQRKDGTEFPVDVMLSVLHTDDGVVVTSIIRDITERKRFENQLQHLADHDALTELFNRRRFDQELAEYVSYTARYGGQGSVFLLDLDRFKYVNDTRGHKAGDEVIRAVGRALHDSVRKTDVVARLGGDEFAVLLRDADQDTAERIAEGMLETIRERRLPLEGQRISMTTSIGIVCFEDEEPSVEDVMVSADLAMYAAKEAGGNRYHVATADGGEYVSGMQVRLNWADQIRRALDEDRFVLYCQPILELASDSITQYELLLRMIGDDGEIIMPAAFIDTAERFGLIQEIDQWVARKAIHLLAEHDVRLEVNVSGKSMGDLAIPELVEREIALTGIDPSRLVFEITETAAIANMEQARAFAERLTRLGCRFALDDFGAGFSSFYYLKYLPLDYLKIDGDFIRSLTSSVTDQLVVKSMVDIARGMGMKTIAEFVEAEETVCMLREKGVDYSQGYYHGAPRPVATEFSKLEVPR
ncbi:EAL domain-containing protein [Solirubrobacter soli]|uniref:EAL domain-containing protein n=1 Tax=Solirubrobacter soli TaxID=363832 RepID=UPI00069E9619|nr:EAL domain-containing protein [Solirubrobacter soli]